MMQRWTDVLMIVVGLLAACGIAFFIFRGRAPVGTRHERAVDSGRKDEILRVLGEEGLGERIAGIAPLIRPSLRYRSVPAPGPSIASGRSRMGGRPDLPAGQAWPESSGKPLAFLAQIDLSEAGRFDLDADLPRTGLLSFFYASAEQPWGFDPRDAGKWKVLHLQGPFAPAPFPDALQAEERFEPRLLETRLELTLPPWESREIERLRLSRRDAERYFEALDAIGSPGPVHRLLGHPDPVQGEMQLECQLASNGISVGTPEGYRDARRAGLEAGADDWLLLLQIDSDDGPGWMWGDAGMLYFWIRRQDLRKGLFDRVWLVLQCG